jgi:hypothetical protein
MLCVFGTRGCLVFALIAFEFGSESLRISETIVMMYMMYMMYIYDVYDVYDVL